MSKPVSKPGTEPSLPSTVVTEWLQPFLDYLAKERRYSAYTVRNYRQAFEDYHRWLTQNGRNATAFGTLTARYVRDFVIEAQRRFGRKIFSTGIPNSAAMAKASVRLGS